jgi:hypothetical protein
VRDDDDFVEFAATGKRAEGVFKYGAAGQLQELFRHIQPGPSA